MQQIEELQPVYVNTNLSVLHLKPVESPFLKNNRIAFGRNKNGTQGGNFGKGKKMQSNWDLIDLPLPETGTNKCAGFYEHKNLNEAYVLVWNSIPENHTIYIMYGNTMTAEIVKRGSNLNFTIDPKNYIAPHRAYVRLIFDIADDEQRHVREKILFYTDGNSWQRWINVLSAIATNGYDADAFPYYKLQPPHFDADELIDYAVRPPMVAPVITELPRTAADLNKQNNILNKGTKFAYRYIMTDGRPTTFSPWSNPFFVARSACSSSKSLTRAVDLNLYAGGPHVEQMQIFVSVDRGDFQLYDTIYKYTSDGNNDPSVIGDSYWLRTDPWAAFQYDDVTNSIHYTYAGDLQAIPFNRDDALDFYNDIPITSMAATPAGDALLLCNNLYNYNNLPSVTLNKFKFSVGQPDTSSLCEPKYVKISVYAFMGRNSETGQVVYQDGPADGQRFGALQNVYKGKDTVDITNTFLNFIGFKTTFPGIFFNFTGANPDLNAYLHRNDLYPIDTININVDESKFFGLDFGENTNFICYLAGTPYTAIGVQYVVAKDGTMTEIGIINKQDPEQIGLIKNTYLNGGFFVQKFDFLVPAGKYIARLANHKASLGGDYASTSTYVQGTISHKYIMNDQNRFFRDPVLYIGNEGKEMHIDATQGDVDVWNSDVDLFYIFVPYIYDSGGLIFGIGANRRWRFIEGYCWEDNDTKQPLEIIAYTATKGDDNTKRGGYQTDHNGFFFQFTKQSDAKESQVAFTTYFHCQANFPIFTTLIQGNDRGYYPGQVASIRNHWDESSAINNRILITGKVVNCLTGEGISSVGVTLTNTTTFFTDSDGNFTIYAREHPSGQRINQTIYFNTGGECLFASCSCGPVATIPFNTIGIPCSINAPRMYQPPINVQLKLIVFNQRGLKRGGRYGFGVTVLDLALRPTFEQEIEYLDIPTVMENQILTPPAINWSITGKLNLPPWARYIIISRTQNQNLSTFLQWVGDKISFINNKGTTVVDGNGAIRAKVTLQSLIDFNIQNNFNTNVNYQFVQGDVLRIIDDGSNNFFDPLLNNGFMDYPILGTDYNQTVIDLGVSNVTTVTTASSTDPDGKVTNARSVTTTNPNSADDGVSLVIEYDERLLQLITAQNVSKTGFWIEIMRPQPAAQIAPYGEVIGTINVINGEPDVTSGVLDTFDTYLQIRTIRIPNDLGKNFSHPFESPSITDFYGFNITSDGRKNTKDPLAKQTWYEDDTVKSDEILNEGRVNGLGRVRTRNRKSFKGQSFGGIVAVHAERNRVVFVCEFDWFVSDYDQVYVKTTAEGNLQANLDENLGNPYPKEGSVFGCAYEDTATIIFSDGMSLWADRYNSAVIAMDYHHTSSATPVGYRNATNIGAEDNQSYFINKFNYVNKFNAQLSDADYLANLIEIIAGLDPQTGEYNLTFRPRNGLATDPQYFVNDEREVFYDLAETFIYNPDIKKWVTFAGYAPEFYGTLSKAQSGVEMISFANGQPWFHNTIGKSGSMNFYGVQTNHYIELALNIDDKKVKIFQNLVIDSPVIKYFMDRIRTEDDQFYSYVPLSHFKRKEGVWYTPFLCNMCTYPDPNNRVGSMLFDGGRTYGKVAVIRLVSDPNQVEEYGELNSVGYRVTGSERSES